MKTAINQDELRRANDTRVIEALMSGTMTRRELQAATLLSWGGITNTVNRLMQAGYIAEHRSDSHSCGRKPGVVELCSDNNFILGVDVNLTGLSGCVTDLTGAIKSEHVSDADFSSPAALMECLNNFITALMEPHADRRILGIGISMQGEVDTYNGSSLRLPQCAGWENVPIRDILSERFGVNVYVAHDPDCMLHAHMHESGACDAVLMRLDRSVGLAAAVNGRLIQGAGLMEAAHMIIDPRGPVCSCGQRGCLNAYVAACERDGAYRALAEPLALTAHNMIQLFRPKTLILSGELMSRADRFMDDFTVRFREISCHAGKIEIQTVSDARSAMHGAALIAAQSAVTTLDIREN